VTGSGSGIGRAIAIECAAEGAAVAVVDYDFETARATVREIETAGGHALAIRADVGHVADVDAAVDAAVALGPIDVLVNAAGVDDLSTPMETTEEALWDRVLSINLKGTAFMIRRVLQEMLPRSAGTIVNVASVASISAMAGGAAYTASKGGVASLTRQVAWEVAGRGVRVNALAPGETRTNLVATTRRVLGDSRLGGAEVPPRVWPSPEDSIPMLRPGDPREMARAALFLAADDSSYVTGQFLVVDGGLSTHLY
jgi:NAD(P)-dependent dehydrogenase (short-subunit alcohol dehydrogenase family)